MTTDESDRQDAGETDPGGPTQYVTDLTTIPCQVGEHLLTALRDEETLAVITTIVTGIRSDRVVSMPLTREQLVEVQVILAQVQATPEDDDAPDVPCVGFHCVLAHRQERDSDGKDDEPGG